MSGTVITLGGIEFSDRPTQAGLGFSDLLGWWSSSQDKASANERPRAHGAFPSPRSWRVSLPISFVAILHTSSEIEYLRLKERVLSVGYDGPVPMIVDTPLGATERMVNVVSSAPSKDRGGVQVGTLAIDLLAHDPRRYAIDAPWLTTRPPISGGGLVWPVVWPAVWRGQPGSDGRIRLENLGTKPSVPEFRVYGGFSEFTLIDVDRQRRITFRFPVPIGSYVEINFSTRKALVDGVSDVSRYLVSREWWDIPGGGTSMVQFAVVGGSGDPYVAGRVKSAW